MTSILPPNGQFAILLLSAPPVTLKQQIFAASLRHLFHLVSGTTHSWLCPSSLAIPSYSLKVVTHPLPHSRCGRPQGPVLGLLSIYTQSLHELIQAQGFNCHVYAKGSEIDTSRPTSSRTPDSHPTVHFNRSHKLNVSQTKFLTFSKSVHRQSSLSWLTTPSFQVLRPKPGIHF